MLAFLREIGNVYQVKKHDPMLAWSVEPGALIVVKGSPALWDWYREHGFQKMPFYWNGRHIFRKEGAALGGSA